MEQAVFEPLLSKSVRISSREILFMTQIIVPPCEVAPNLNTRSERKVELFAMKSSESLTSVVNQVSQIHMTSKLFNSIKLDKHFFRSDL